MNNKKTILTGIKNLKMQIKRLKTEVHALENMVGEMENSLDSEDTNVTCTDEPVLPKSLDFQEMKDLLDKLAEAGILKASYALKNQSWTERSVMLHSCLEKCRECACGSLSLSCGIVIKVLCRVPIRSTVILKLLCFIIRNWSEL